MEKEVRQIKMFVSQSSEGRQAWIDEHIDELKGYKIISFDKIMADIAVGIERITATEPGKSLPLKEVARQYLEESGNISLDHIARYQSASHPTISVTDILNNLGDKPYDGIKATDDNGFKRYLDLAGHIYHTQLIKAVENGDNILIDKNNRTKFVREEAMELVKKSDKYKYYSTALYTPVLEENLSPEVKDAVGAKPKKPFEPPQKGEFSTIEVISMPRLESGLGTLIRSANAGSGVNNGRER